MTKDLRYYLKKAKKEKWAIGQFNFSDFPQMEGVVKAAKELNSPIILGTSEGESRFLGLKQAVALKKSFESETGLPIFLNLDHGKDFEYIKKAIEVGYDMIHFDGSKLPLKENIQKTKEVIKYAKTYGTVIEGEVGTIATDASKVYEQNVEIRPEDFTNPKDALEYIGNAPVDCLAVSIGNIHGMNASGQDPALDLKRLQELKKALKDCLLVLHGGSGISQSDIKKAIKLGMVKINVNTELRVAFTDTLKKSFADNPKETTPYKYLPETVRAVQKVVEDKIKLFGSKNKV